MDTTSVVDVIMEEVALARDATLLAYLHGAARDGTFNRTHRTWRIAQANRDWLGVLQAQVAVLGRRSWLYREGSRDVWVLETKLDLAGPPTYRSANERVAFARGYFDAEGGVPRSTWARFYIQLVQKNREDLTRLRQLLEKEGIRCGRVHNPSFRIDPNFWRFYVRTASHRRFVQVIGSWHPRKRAVLEARFEPPPQSVPLESGDGEDVDASRHATSGSRLSP